MSFVCKILFLIKENMLVLLQHSSEVSSSPRR